MRLHTRVPVKAVGGKCGGRDGTCRASGGGAEGKGKLGTRSMERAFMASTTPSSAVVAISGGACSGKVSLNTADEYSLETSGERGPRHCFRGAQIPTCANDACDKAT